MSGSPDPTQAYFNFIGTTPYEPANKKLAKLAPLSRLDLILDGLMTEQRATEQSPNRARTLMVLYRLELEAKELRSQLEALSDMHRV